MYPFARFLLALRSARSTGPMDPFETHVSTHICWPWDLDVFLELNNGRALTLYDLGRFGLGQRTGLIALLRREGWGLAVAGSSIRYRRRLHGFQRFEMRTRVLGWDQRFIYIEQSMWRQGQCISHVLIRAAVTNGQGIVPTDHLTLALGAGGVSPDLPDWVTAWIAAEALRPWPPMQDSKADNSARAA